MSEVMQFEITSKDGVTLETEGRICEKHIRVVPRLAPLEAELGGKYPVPDGYTGFGDVTVKPKLLPITIEKAGSYLVPEGYAGHGEIKCEPRLTNLVVQNNGTYRIPDDMVGYEEVQVEVWGIPKVNKRITYYCGLNTYNNLAPEIPITYSELGVDSSAELRWTGFCVTGTSMGENGAFKVYTSSSDESIYRTLGIAESNIYDRDQGNNEYGRWGEQGRIVFYVMVRTNVLARYEITPIKIDSNTPSYYEVEDI